MSSTLDGLDFGTVRRTGTPRLVDYNHEHSIEVDETSTPASTTLTDSDHLEWSSGSADGQRGWMSVSGGDRGAIVQASFPASIDHTNPPSDLSTGELAVLAYAPSWAYHIAPASTGDDFTSIDSCTPPCAETHRVPEDVDHEVAFGGEITIDESPGSPTKPNAIPGSYGASIAVTVSCL